ncbi:transcriptional regulator, asnC family [Streptomyces laurentii]|uniref:Transcriptional regulator, asnC family n=1 Tax=Streptomyces laurentii TaxID=39478 RepID=A0A160P1U2_STRLU|nr:transcriptional regulator, asnC family [Streptomyces laurentii]
MQTGESVLGEMDLALIHALQIAPRASWTQLSAVLGASPDTLARRWEHLTAGGYAWAGFLAQPPNTGALVCAWVEVTCTPGFSEAAAIELSGDPDTLIVSRVTGDTDLLLLVMCPGLDGLDDYLVGRVRRLPGVAATQTQVITGIHSNRDLWELDQLTPRQRRQLAELSGPATGTRPASASGSVTPGSGRGSGPGSVRSRARRPAARLSELDVALVLELAGDARRTAAELARICEVSESTVRRRLDVLVNGGALIHHCSPAPRFSGRPMWAMIKAEVPPLGTPAAVTALARLRQNCLVTSVTGPHNLAIGGWLRSVDELYELTTAIERTTPSIRIAATSLSLRIHKTGAQVLGPDGRRRDCVRPEARLLSSA